MASFIPRKGPKGKRVWQAHIRRRGFPAQVRTLDSKAKAEAWASTIESEMARGMFVSRSEAEGTTLSEALDRYLVEVSSQKKGRAAETSVASVWRQNVIASRPLSGIRGHNLTKVRDAWLSEATPAFPLPMPTPFDGYVEVLARVSSTCLVTVQRNRYSVPCHLANQKVAIHLYPARIEVSAENAIVACHTRLLERDQVSYDWQHYIPLIEKKPGALRNGAPFADMPVPFAKLQTALRRRERQQGDRTMARVLAAVPAHGLEAVLVAVELVLESGLLSVEHVINVLARLSPSPLPAQVETRLTLIEEPLADTSRYDSLNAQEVSHV